MTHQYRSGRQGSWEQPRQQYLGSAAEPPPAAVGTGRRAGAAVGTGRHPDAAFPVATAAPGLARPPGAAAACDRTLAQQGEGDHTYRLP